jgi:hypothetical protein
MSSQQLMRGILQTQLLTLGWGAQTAFEGKPFAPVADTPYQEVSTFFAEPFDRTLGGSSEQRGVFQVRLLYPVSQVAAEGVGVPQARADAIKAAFPRNMKFLSGGQTVKVMRTPAISRGPVQGDRDVTIVRVRFTDR